MLDTLEKPAAEAAKTKTCLTPDEFTVFTERKLREPAGLTFANGRSSQPFTWRGGNITRVKIDAAWIAFAWNGVMYRTETLDHRNNLIKWVLSGGVARFSKERDLKDFVGPPGVAIYKI